MTTQHELLQSAYDEIDQYKTLIRELRELHQRQPVSWEPYGDCHECAEAWPCSTAKIIDRCAPEASDE